MARIQQIKHPDGDVIYPISHTNAIIDDSGNRLENVLQDLKQNSSIWKIGDDNAVYNNRPNGSIRLGTGLYIAQTDETGDNEINMSAIAGITLGTSSTHSIYIGTSVYIGTNVYIDSSFDTRRYFDSNNGLISARIPIDSSLKNSSKLAVNIEPQSNGNIKIGDTLFMPATPSGDPMHYAYETAGAKYNSTTDFIVKDAPWADMVDTIDDKAKWGFDVVDASQVKQMTISGTTYNYVQTTRQSPEGTTEPRYFLVGQASDGTWVEDETKVLHLPGHWYLNGLGDITDKEMKKVWEAPHNAIYLAAYSETQLRTIIASGNGSSAASDVVGWLVGSTIESAVFNRSFYPSKVSKNTFNAKPLRYIIQSKDISNHIYSYLGYEIPITELRGAMFYSLRKELSLTSLIISKPSILYAINNATPTTAITITLHADRYAQLSEDADIVAALEAKNTELEGTGGSISLVSA